MAKNPQRKAEYDAYIKSAKWKKLRALVLKLAKNRCQDCKEHYATQVHHLTYERFRNERLSDLQALCGPCHKKADKEREEKQEAEFEAYAAQCLEDAQFNGWVRAVYGEGAEIDESMWEEFREFKEGKDSERFGY